MVVNFTSCIRNVFKGIHYAIVDVEGTKGICVQIPENHPFRQRDSSLISQRKLVAEGNFPQLSATGYWFCFECDSELHDEQLTQLCREMINHVRRPYWTMFKRGIRRFLANLKHL